MSDRSDRHECEVCGVYSPFGYLQADRTYRWYCFKHRLEGYKLPDLAPMPSLAGQGDLLADLPNPNPTAFARYEHSDKPWGDKYEAWLIDEDNVPLGSDGGPGGEDFRFKAERKIGPHPKDGKVVGTVIGDLIKRGYLERTDEMRRPRDKKSKGSEKRVVRRTYRR